MTRKSDGVLLVFPAYVLIWMLRPLFPKDHLLKRVSLRLFARNATPLASLYGLFFWNVIVCGIGLILVRIYL